jgi:hypothetical protein
MTLYAIQGNRIVIDGVVTGYQAPSLEAKRLYQGRVNASLYIDELFHIFAKVGKEYPILLDGRVLCYGLTSRPNIGYTLGQAKDYLDPDLDDILLIASCPSSWTHEERGGLYMIDYQIIKVYKDIPVIDSLLEEF